MDIKVEFDIFANDSLAENAGGDCVSDLQCRACLSINRQFYSLNKDSELGMLFLKTCSFYEEVPLNVYLCWECVSVLRKLVLFKNKVQYAESLLRSQLCDEEPVKCLTTLCISKVINTDASVPIEEDGDVIEREVKPSEQIAQTDIKDEEDIEEDVPPDATIDEGMQVDDSEDDTLDTEDKHVTETVLKDVKKRKEKKGEEKVKKIKMRNIENRKSKKRYKYINVGVRRMVEKVSLTEEELIEWMEMERNSEIFKKMERKCDLCLVELKKNFKLETHLMKTHQKSLKRPEQCIVCKVYISKKKLALHMKHHVGRVCSECGYKCITYYNMMRHMDIEHALAVQCLDCGAKCSSPKAYYEHCKEYHSTFKCNDCEFETRRREILIKHIGRHHSAFRCEQCRKVFSSIKTYEYHKVSYHFVDRTEASFCVQCNIQFDNMVLFKRHINISKAHMHERGNKVKPTSFQCTACPNVYKSNASMKNHYRYAHTDTTRFYCELCDRYFVNQTRLLDHRRSLHENYVPPKDKFCNICGRGFAARRTLINHIRTHTGERPYECTMCDAKFAQKVALKVHMKHIHLKVKRKYKNNSVAS